MWPCQLVQLDPPVTHTCCSAGFFAVIPAVKGGRVCQNLSKLWAGKRFGVRPAADMQCSPMTARLCSPQCVRRTGGDVPGGGQADMWRPSTSTCHTMTAGLANAPTPLSSHSARGIGPPFFCFGRYHGTARQPAGGRGPEESRTEKKKRGACRHSSYAAVCLSLPCRPTLGVARGLTVGSPWHDVRIGHDASRPGMLR